MAFVDRDLTCFDCGSVFVFSAGEQQFFQDMGFKNDPKRCKACKAKLAGTRRIETHVTCSECGAETTVPFKPTQGKPVLCRACFDNQAQRLAKFRSVE
ncbi:MAG TPA: zinc-ribbon domain containing protein [Terracidiphilus sp.]|jgi:CxxC-x17-CxxC domain-containing protein